MTRLSLPASLIAFALASAPAVGQTPPRIPDGAVEYAPAKYTQSLYRLDERPTVELVRVTALPDKVWLQSGGLEGVAGAVSRKYRSLPKGEAVAYRLAPVSVKNRFGFMQAETGVTRSYPAGTRFDDVLSYKGVVFEHRIREKQPTGKWESSVIFRDEAARPPGYTGLKATCASCHDQAGTGGYGVGLVPGGDTVLSDPLDWTVLKAEWKSEVDVR